MSVVKEAPSTTEPGRARRFPGYVAGVAGIALLAGVLIYFAAHVSMLADVLAVVLGGFVSLLGALLLSLAVFLSASSIVARRVGCIAAIFFGVPLALLFIFMVVSLFQTTRPVLDA